MINEDATVIQALVVSFLNPTWSCPSQHSSQVQGNSDHGLISSTTNSISYAFFPISVTSRTHWKDSLYIAHWAFMMKYEWYDVFCSWFHVFYPFPNGLSVRSVVTQLLVEIVALKTRLKVICLSANNWTNIHIYRLQLAVRSLCALYIRNLCPECHNKSIIYRVFSTT